MPSLPQSEAIPLIRSSNLQKIMVFNFHHQPFLLPLTNPEKSLNLMSLQWKKIKQSSRTGQNQYTVLKDSPNNVVQALTDIINCSLFTSNFLTAWNLAEVVTLLYEGDH